MAAVSNEMIYAVPLDIAAPIARLDEGRQDLLAGARALRAESDGFRASLARGSAVRRAH